MNGQNSFYLKKIAENLNEITSYAEPISLTPKNVIYYSAHAKDVKGTVRNKARLFVQLGLVEYDEKKFFVNPIKGYNKTRYEVIKRKVGFECSCQACQTRIKRGEYTPAIEERAACSHILAVLFWLKIKHWRKEK